MTRAAHLCELVFSSNLPPGLTVAQYSALRIIAELDGDMTITRLARVMTVSQPTMSSTVRKLEEKGLIELSTPPMDGRAKHIVLTAEGDRARRQADRSVLPVVDAIADALELEAWLELHPVLTQLNTTLDEQVQTE